MQKSAKSTHTDGHFFVPDDDDDSKKETAHYGELVNIGVYAINVNKKSLFF